MVTYSVRHFALALDLGKPLEQVKLLLVSALGVFKLLLIQDEHRRNVLRRQAHS